MGYGPLAECNTILNFSSQRAYCRTSISYPTAFIIYLYKLTGLARDHRDHAGHLSQLKMKHMPCKATYHLYEPLSQYRESCPWSLVVCRGNHPHPIPIPHKTPVHVQRELRQILESLDDDLADLTPRRFLRHPILKTYLSSHFPLIQNPTLCDLHVSLANRSHVKYYIDRMKSDLFPCGTGWEGQQIESQLEVYRSSYLFNLF